MTPAPEFSEPFCFPMLLADIGGTNLRLAVLEGPQAQPEFLPVRRCADYDGLESAVSDILTDSSRPKVQSAMLALAGPVDGVTFRITNSSWTIDPAALRRAFDLREVMVVNDFEADALALPGLAPEDLQVIGDGQPVPDTARLILGPGTGLGAAGLVRTCCGWCPVAGEAGHMSLGPIGEEELALWPHIEVPDGRLSVENVLSGSGVMRLYRAFASLNGVDPVLETPEAVTAAADAGDELASQTLTRFAIILGRIAGDLALVYLARGGVYLAGGVVGSLERWLTSGAFRAAFEAKGPHRAIMSRIPTQIVKHPFPGLVGMAAFARTPSAFALDCDRRRWRA